MGILSAVKETVGGVIFGETIKDYGVIARGSRWGCTSTYSAFIAQKSGPPVLWLKISQRGGANSRTHYIDLSRESVQRFADVFTNVLDSV